MRIDLRDERRQRIGRVVVDPAVRPTRVTTADTGRDVFLNWDRALDDAGRLRRCTACGCDDLYRIRAFPPLTGFVVVLAFAGAVVGVLGFATNIYVIGLMILVLLADVALFIFPKERLVCYRCGTSYAAADISRHHRPWDRSVAERYPAPRRARLQRRAEEAAAHAR